MKRKHKIILIISLLLNAFFIGRYCFHFYKAYKTYQVKNIDYSTGSKAFFEALKINHPELAGKKYFYVNVWNTACVPCIKEMPFLDSLAGTIQKDDIGYIYVSDDADNKVNSFLEKKHIPSKNFAFLNDMNDFISSVCITKNNSDKVYPMHIVMDNMGNILYYSKGTFNYMIINDSATEQQIKQQQKFNTPPFVEIIKTLQ